MKVMKDKVRRKRINWYKEFLKLKDPELEHDFCVLMSHLYHRRSGMRAMSINRLAYYVLKKHYSTTTIADLCEKLGI